MALKVIKTKDYQVFHDSVYVNPIIKSDHLTLSGRLFNVKKDPDIPPDSIALNRIQRSFLGDVNTIGWAIPIETFDVNIKKVPIIICAEIEILSSMKIQIDCSEFSGILHDIYPNLILHSGHTFIHKIGNTPIQCKVVEITTDCEDTTYGITGDNTVYVFSTSPFNKNTLLIDHGSYKPIFKESINLMKLGIGGLDKEMLTIFRRAFATRSIPKKILTAMNIKPIRGMLLYGPPGCGKTTIARCLANMLNCKESNIKKISGPQILDKFVGNTEKNVRSLFEDAIKNQHNGELYVIIWDELDSSCPPRGSTRDGTAVYDNIVNQILAILDGADALDNILFIGMTNRRDHIDEALLRPGRLELHIEIGLPDIIGRTQILNIHTDSMSTGGFLAPDVDITQLAESTNNYTGAELEGIVKNAASFAIAREIDISKSEQQWDIYPIVSQSDFMRAISETAPMFGNISLDIEKITKTPIQFWSPEIRKIYNGLLSKISSVQRGHIGIVSIVGSQYIGKTLMACHVAVDSKVNCVKILRANQLIGKFNRSKIIAETFDRCMQTFESILIIDSIEKIIEWSNDGSLYNNDTLQTIMSILDTPLDKSRRMVVIITSSHRTDLMMRFDLNRLIDEEFIMPDRIESDAQFSIPVEVGEYVSDVFRSLKYRQMIDL